MHIAQCAVQSAQYICTRVVPFHALIASKHSGVERGGGAAGPPPLLRLRSSNTSLGVGPRRPVRNSFFRGGGGGPTALRANRPTGGGGC